MSLYFYAMFLRSYELLGQTVANLETNLALILVAHGIWVVARPRVTEALRAGKESLESKYVSSFPAQGWQSLVALCDPAWHSRASTRLSEYEELIIHGTERQSGDISRFLERAVGILR